MKEKKYLWIQSITKKSVSAVTAVGMLGAMITMTPAVHAARIDDSGSSISGKMNTSRLGELIVLDGLFAPSYGVSGQSQRRVSRLGELVVLSNLFQDRTEVSTTPPSPEPSPTPTTTPPVVDVEAPIISNVAVENTTASSTQIVWKTDEESTSKVFYSSSFPVVLSTASVASSTELTMDHELSLSPLESDTTYFFIIESLDDAGNITRTIQLSFTTDA